MSSIAHLKGFYGSTMAPETLDAFLARSVKVPDWGVISELYDSKWFGYRFMTPGQTLYMFADRYRRAYTGVIGRSTRRHIKYSTLTAANLITRVNKGQVTGLWKAMCFADAFGIPYDFYCSTVMEMADREGWDSLPQPSQIYHTRFIWQIKQKWEERLKSGTLIRTEAPQYFLSNYEGNAWQDEYMKWLLDQALERPNPKFALAKIMFEEPQVKPSFAANFIDLERITDARDAARKP